VQQSPQQHDTNTLDVAQTLRRITMSGPSKPAGYTSLSTYLVVHGAQKVIDFLKQTFGRSTELRRYDNPDGTIMHAEVRVDDTVVMIADGGGAWPPFPSWLHVYVPDVDATYRRRAGSRRRLRARATSARGRSRPEGWRQRSRWKYMVGGLDAGGMTARERG
jgi:hypothetical protein